MARRAKYRPACRFAAPACLALAILVAVPQAARAGAWTLPAGRGEVIATGIWSRADAAFAAGAGSLPSDFGKGAASLFVQHGWTDRLTVFSKIEVARESDGVSGYERSGVSELLGGARLRLFKHGGFVAAAELAGGFAPGDGPLLAAARTTLEPRVAAGYGFELAGLPGFVDAEAAYRLRTGGDASDELRLDVTAGLRAWRRWLFLARSNSTLAVSGTGAAAPYAYHKLQGSVVFDVADRWSIEAGLFTTIAGSNAPKERGLVTALWYRY
ncbi:hypothetical protein [Jiella sonneratiae]|uniref:YaiO family outer membrane beta-barrel protein n=1 Tax=Jiella sonneratiae TaxID=2816856 RepID=A0ABS3J7A2_9HYPH|nr:hypothetical protein [Jiella sonneratiae]MBO0904466.1 hypothetical protein [Jiella sonneratiae]